MLHVPTPSGEMAFRLSEFIRLYKMSRTQAYVEINAGRLKTYTVGRYRMVSARAADKWQRDREAEASAT